MWKLGTALTAVGVLALELGAPGGPEATASRPAPAWKNTSWLNGDRALSLESLKGQVVLLNFWVFTCGNCTRTLPSLIRFDSLYRGQGLTTIGIHTPEFPPSGGEHDKGNVSRALERYRVTWPNAQDNDYATWNLYGIRYWPSFVLIDRKGQIRYEGYGEFHIGDQADQLWERRIQGLLAEGAPVRVGRATREGVGVVLAEPSKGIRINAQLVPLLEFPDGTSLRLDRGRRTADSAYFAEAPWAPLPGRVVDGSMLRVSYCQGDEKVCRTVTLPVPPAT
jgi:thiol-disulfide isomerase/thioredoxin